MNVPIKDVREIDHAFDESLRQFLEDVPLNKAPAEKPSVPVTGTAAQAGNQAPASAEKKAAQKAAIVEEIERSINFIAGDTEVFEIRVPEVPNARGRPFTASGYFDRQHRREAAEAAFHYSYVKKAPGVYMTLNPCNPALLARSENKMTDYAKHTTTDAEIIARKWLFVDLDPHRPSGIAASKEEKQTAINLGENLMEKLRQYGFGYPVWEDSGNGQYLLFRIDELNDEPTTKLIQSFYSGLGVLAGSYDSSKPYAEIDSTVYNAARIARIGGTVNRKGNSTADRPHRLCQLHQPAEDEPIGIVSHERIEAVAALALPQNANGKPPIGAVQRAAGTHQAGRIDVPLYCSDYSVKIRGTKPLPGGTAYLLETCPFDANHGSKGETCIIQADSGLVTFHCKHDSCSGQTWHSFKDRVGKVEPRHTGKTASSGPRISYKPVAPGTWVIAGDRGNRGQVTSNDGGPTCWIHFTSPEGQEADKELPKSELRTLDGKPLAEPDEPPRFIVTMMTSAQLDDLATEPRYIVKNAVPAGQVGAIGAKSKGCKTGVAIDLTISVASGTRFLNEFEVPEPAAVLNLCGESGPSKVRRQARQICEARGLVLRDLPVFWGFDLPKLCLPFHIDALATFIVQNKIALAIIDPLYLALFTAETAGRSGDLYTMGATFEPLTAVCRDTGASILLVHHFRKNRGDDQQEPCSLEELSQAGLAEVVRWWLLIERREPYAGDGKHALWLRVGGSEGHASFWGLDIDEGLTVDPEGNQRTTKWETTLSRVQDTKAEEKRQRENRKALDLEKREGEHAEKLVLALRKYPAGQTARQLRADSRLNGDNFLRAAAVLRQAGRIEEIIIKKRGVDHDGYKLKN
ncbi:MAG: AAA family ATPase [Thermoguttaceae bacterium]